MIGLFKIMSMIRRGSGANLNFFRPAAESRNGDGIVTVMSYGASDEHPMSTRSASDGDRRKAGIWKYAAMVLVLLMLGVGNAWGGGTSYSTKMRTYVVPDDTGKGLVYANKSNSVSVTAESYSDRSQTDEVAGANGKNQSFYGWAKPARGYKFNKWEGYDYWNSGNNDRNSEQNLEGAAKPQAHTGTADLIYAQSWSGGNSTKAVCRTAKATWIADDSKCVVTYKEPLGGSYSVSYSYLKVESNKFKTATETLSLSPGNGDKRPYGLTDAEHENGYSYAADVIKLTVPSADRANFIGWYKGDTYLGNTAADFVYSIKDNPGNANVSARFKWIVVSTPEETLISTKSGNTDVAASVDFEMTSLTGTWAAADFTVTLADATGTGTFDNITKSYTGNTLTVNFTYNANGTYGSMSTVNIQVTPANGTGATASVKASAEEEVSYESKVLVGGEVDKTGTLAAMLDYANGLTADDVTLQLAQNVTVATTLQFKRTLTLDLNSKTLSSTTLNNLILVKGNSASDNVKLTIDDASELKAGAISLTKSNNGIIQGIKVDDANQLILNAGYVSIENTAAYASNNNAKAYGVGLDGTATLKMYGGGVSATSDHNAYGVYAGAGYATLFVGSISASAKEEAYGIYSAATTNISSGVSISATTTLGNTATAIYVNGGATVLDNVALTATSAASYAYGANIQAGQLSMNGGSATVEAATSYVYGVNVQSGASATVQMNASITAEATGGSGTKVYGVNNLGTIKLDNSTITATSPTDYATAVNSETSAISTTIDGGIYSAISSTGNAYGLHHQYGALNVDGGSFTATSAGNNVYGARTIVDATIKNATLSGETTESGSTVYGFASDEENKNVTLTNCTIEAKSASSVAYAIYSRANTNINDSKLEAKTLSGAEAYGLYAVAGNNTLTNTDATVDAYTTHAYGIQYLSGSLSVSGGEFTVEAQQASAKVAGDTEVYGVKVADGKTVSLINVIFDVEGSSSSFSRKAYGIYTGTGIIYSTGSTYTVRAAKEVYGVYAGASSTINLKNNTITATAATSSTANGIYSNSRFTVDGDEISADAATYPAYTFCFGSSANGDVFGGKFKAEGSSSANDQIIAPINKDASAENVHIKGGFFNDVVQLRYYIPEEYDIYGVDNGAPEYTQGYYYTVNDHLPYENICHITEANVGFPTLAEAFDYARNHTGTNYNIVMTQPYTLPAGAYLLPSNATLVVPDKVSRTVAQGATPDVRKASTDLVRENRCLTFAAGANLDVHGKIEVSAQQYAFNTGQICYVTGPYGRIHLEKGSSIILNSNARLYAWGYVTGTGNIYVKSGAIVLEDFQVGDMKGANDLSSYWLGTTNKNTYKVFPINQYYIQNVEAPTTYYYGAQLQASINYLTSSGATATMVSQNAIKIVGNTGSLFQVTSSDVSCWVRKSYDPINDRVVWETNSSAKLGELTINMSGYSMESKYFVLPITNNMTLHALNGLLTVTQNTVLLPGAEVIVDKEATLHINDKDPQSKAMGLYLYDQAQWSANATPAVYSPSWEDGKNPRVQNGTDKYGKMADASIYVKGKIEIEGALYTTAGGAAIYSDEVNAGTVNFLVAAAADGTLYKKYDGTGATTATSAQLRNGGKTGTTFTATKGVAAANDTYAYMDLDENGAYEWTNLAAVDECVVKDKSTNVYYAKPQGYVAITSATEDANHLFHSVAGSKLFIQQTTASGCQWWEVTRVGETSVYYCATNDKYYEYKSGAWNEVKRSVTFYYTDPKDDSANKKKVLSVNYMARPDAKVVTNPTKAEDVAATYQFYGWKSSVTGNVYEYTDELEEAENDMYYLPVFTTITKKYTITFKKAKDNTDVPVECFYGQSPEYEASRASSAQYDYEFTGWKAANNTVYSVGQALPVVSGATNYTAQWAEHTRSYNITWKNGFDVLEVDENQLYGTATAYNGASLPTKDADDDYEYAFSKWKSSLNGNSYNNGSTPTVAGETTYEAQYTTTPRYAITFNNYDGEQLARTIYTQGLTPAYDGVPARKRDADGYFKFIGWKNSNGTDYAANVALPAVSKKETYTAQYEYVTEFFTITLKNVDGNGAEWSGKFGAGAIPFYNPNDDDVPVTPTKTSTDPHYSYVFDGWSLTDGGAKLDPTPAVTENATYWALFTLVENKYTVSFASNNEAWGIVSRDDVKEVPHGTAITVNGNTLTVNGKTITATPAAEDAQYMYHFEGWESVPSTVTGETEIQAVFKAYVATVTAGGNTTYHTTIADAFTTAKTKTHSTITLLRDVSIGAIDLTYNVAKTCTLDLNGHTISGTSNRLLTINNVSADFTITDNSESKLGKLSMSTSSTAGAAFCAYLVSGTLKLEAGTIYLYTTSTESNAVGVRVDGGEFIMNGGTVHTVATQKDRVAHGVQPLNSAKATINGGTVRAESANGVGSGMYVTGTITVNGGKFYVTGKTAYMVHASTITPTKVKLQGGYYNINTNMATCVVSSYSLRATTTAEKVEVGNDYNYRVVATYTVTFKDGDNNTIQSGLVEKGQTPAYIGATPTKTNTAEYTYTFDGWSTTDGGNTLASLPAVSANATYYAHYAQAEKKYAVSVSAGANGSVSPASVSNIGCETASGDITATPNVGYKFDNWTIPTGVSLAEGYTATSNSVRIHATAADKTITANFVPRTDINYTVRHFQQNIADNNYTEVTADAQTLHGTTATATNAVAKNYTGFTAQAFEQGIVAGDGSTVVEIYYNRKTYTITWVDGNGTTIETDEHVKYGATPSYTGETPTKTATAQYTYTFNNTWSPAIVFVTGDATYTAQFGSTVNEYTITWVDGNGETLKTEQVEYGQTPSYTGETPTKTATAQYTYTFNNTWSPAIEAVTGNATYTAQFSSTVNKYHITWVVKLNGETLESKEEDVEYGQKPSYGSTPTKEQTESQVFTFSGWTPAVVSVTGNQTYTGSFKAEARKYTIRFVNDNDVELQRSEVAYGTTPVYEGTPVSSFDATAEFTGWTPEIVVVGGEATYKATYLIPLSTPIVIESKDSYTVSTNTSTSTTTVKVEGTLSVENGAILTTDALILEGTPNSSGEIKGAGTVNTGRAYFDLSNGDKGFSAGTWYAVAVPWQVAVPAGDKIHNGIYITNDGETFVQQELGRSYDLIYYDGERRAKEGPRRCWQYVEDDLSTEQIMYPGRAYMIYLTSSAKTIRFERKEGAELLTSSLQTQIYASETGNGTDADWNGIANPATYHAYLNVGATEDKAQVYNPDTKGYEWLDMSKNKLIVGQPIFVQPAEAAIVVASDSYGPLSAPRRANGQTASLTRYELMLAASDADVSDRIIVRMDEDKEVDEYIVGQDLVKLGVSSVVPQMWINRYNSQMSINTVAPEENVADYPLGIFAPKNGEYDLFLEDEQNTEAALYLTYDGEAIWNLSYGGYQLNLEKGTNNHYGLRIVVKAPQVTTGMEEATILNGEQVRKVIVNDLVYIIRNGEMYTVTGNKVQ